VTRNDTRFGIFGFLITTVLALVAIVMFARYPTIFRTGREYRAVFHSVAGLNRGDEVRYGGLLVGAVTDLELSPNDPTQIVVQFRVRRNTPMRVDTRASISQVGLLGQPYLSLHPGLPQAVALAEHGTVPSTDSPTFQDAVSRLAAFLDRADTLLTGAERVARGSPFDRFDRALARLDLTLARVDTLAAVGLHGTTRTFAQLDTTTARLQSLIERSNRLVVALDTTVRTTAPGLATTQTEALQTVRQMRLLIGDLRDALQQEGGVEQLVRNLTTAADRVARLTERIEEDPTSVLKKRGTPVKIAGPAVRQ
jgi:phospholipid/cholesterol/gamma-HCH transport system substrate-binding protein